MTARCTIHGAHGRRCDDDRGACTFYHYDGDAAEEQHELDDADRMAGW